MSSDELADQQSVSKGELGACERRSAHGLSVPKEFKQSPTIKPARFRKKFLPKQGPGLVPEPINAQSASRRMEKRGEAIFRKVKSAIVQEDADD
jgi:hypothetical protein